MNLVLARQRIDKERVLWTRVTAIEPAGQVSDGPDVDATGPTQSHTSNKVSPTPSLLPQHSISLPSSTYNPSADRLLANVITQPPSNPSTDGRSLAEYLARQWAEINSLPPV
jgi:hypothetical protein